MVYEYYLGVLEPYFPGGSYTVTGTLTITAMATSMAITTIAVMGTVTAVVQHWGQCGGQGWTGLITCVLLYTCQVLNLYYLQCL